MKFYWIFLVIFTASLSTKSFGQTKNFENLKTQFLPTTIGIKGIESLNFKYMALPNIKLAPQSILYTKKILVPASYNYDELGAFCKLEVKIEQKIKIPVKIRLGEVNLVEMKEGKPYTPSPWQGTN